MKGLIVAVTIALAFLFGFLWARERRAPPPGPPRVDTVVVVPSEFQAAVSKLVVDHRSLRARLEGMRPVTPRTVLVTDTLIITDTVVIALRASGGLVDAQLAVLGDSSSALHSGVDLRNCDDGWAYAGGVWTCDPARFGHLSVALSLRGEWKAGIVTPGVSVRWRPRFRSEWELSVARTWSDWQAEMTRGWRIW